MSSSFHRNIWKFLKSKRKGKEWEANFKKCNEREKNIWRVGYGDERGSHSLCVLLCGLYLFFKQGRLFYCYKNGNKRKKLTRLRNDYKTERNT